MTVATSLCTGDLATGTTLNVSAGRGLLNALLAISDGANPATITAYDSLTGSGKMVAQVTAELGTTQSICFTNPVRCDIGLTFVVSGTGAVGIGYHGA